MKLKYILAIFIVLVVSSNLFADNISDIIDNVKQNNIEIKRINSKMTSDISSIKSTNNLNNPQVEMEYLFGEKKVGGDKWQIGISQEFDWPGLYGSRSKSNNIRIEALQYLKDATVLEIVMKARLICNDIININRKIALQKIMLNNVTHLYDEYKKGYDHGEITILDINKLRLERLGANNALSTLLTEKANAINELKIINGNIEIPGAYLDKLENYQDTELKPMDYYLKNLESNDPEAKYLNLSSEANKNDIKSAKLGWAPSIAIGYKFSQELGEKFNGFTVGLSLPIFSNRNKTNAAQAQYAADLLGEENIIMTKELTARGEYNKMQSLSTQITDYKSILNDNNNMEMLNKALKGGQITLITYLLEMKYFIEATTTLNDMEYQYNVLYIQLDKYSNL